MTDALWVFGYGSLIWDPGFAWSERQTATLEGYRRSFCMHSYHYRGTPEAPGLVLALDAASGALCHGVAYAVPPEIVDETLEYLRAREMISAAYREERQKVRLQDGRMVEALCYIIERDHAQYAQGLTLEDQARIIATACGERGPNIDYLLRTQSDLSALALPDPELDWLSHRVRELQGSAEKPERRIG